MRREIFTLHTCGFLPADDGHICALNACLTSEERERAARFVFPASRRSYVLAHALLHCAIEQVIGAHEPRRFVKGKFGKPALSSSRTDLRFSLAHAETLVAVATANGVEIGVDVESIDRKADELTFSRVVLASSEIEELPSFPPWCNRPIQLWTAKEAIAKAVGLGLSLPFPSIELGGSPLRLKSLPGAVGDADVWWLKSFVDAAHWISVAAPLRPAEFVHRHWTAKDLAAIMAASSSVSGL